jgi:hypothetical protein
MRRSFSRNLCDTKTVQMIPESIPAFPRGVKYRYDAARSAWVDAPFMVIEADVLELLGALALSGVVQDKGAVV